MQVAFFVDGWESGSWRVVASPGPSFGSAGRGRLWRVLINASVAPEVQATFCRRLNMLRAGLTRQLDTQAVKDR
jgi:hypothetical protein